MSVDERCCLRLLLLPTACTQKSASDFLFSAISECALLVSSAWEAREDWNRVRWVNVFVVQKFKYCRVHVAHVVMLSFA